MLLAFDIGNIIRVPFGYLLDILYRFTSNYGLALILFAVAVKVILLPVSAKSKRSMMKLSRITPKVQEIQEKFKSDSVKQSQAVQELYKTEGVSMMGGCLWSFVPLLILFPLFQVIRLPLEYMLHLSQEDAWAIVDIVKNSGLSTLFTAGNDYYDQVIAAPYLSQFVSQIKEAIPNVQDSVLNGINFGFLGIDLGATPSFNIFSSDWVWDWAHVGGFLLPVISAGSQVVSTLISQKLNDSVITNEKGLQDKEAAKNAKSNQTNKVMMWMMPIMSLWIGFTVPGALSLYWLAQGLISLVLDNYLTIKYRKIYEAEDAIKLEKAMAEEAAEAEKERIRAEKRAANPDGITENTSKKKLQQQKQQAEEAAKAAAAREYAARKSGEEAAAAPEESQPQDKPTDRPNRRGRAYDPNRYSSETTEE